MQTHIDVAASGVGVRADLVGSVDQALCVSLFQARQINVQIDVQTETTRNLTDTDVGGDRGVVRDFAFGLTGNEFQRADEAGRVAGSEQLLRVGGRAAGTAEFFGVASLTSRTLSLEIARPSRPPVEVAIAV